MKRKHERTRQMIGRAQKYNHLISWPSALCVLALVMPLNLALFGDLQGTWILAVLGFSSLFNAFAVLGTGILSGVGLQKRAAFLVLGAAIIKIPLNIILVTNIGLIGAAISSLLVYGLLAGANVVLIKSRYSFAAFPKGTGTYIVSGVLTGALIGIPTLFFDVEAWSRIEAFAYVIVSIPAGIAFYGGLVWKFNGSGDFHGIPVIGRLVDKIERKERRETRVME
ncbi:MAG TPA: polysaccharide biosynthesis C-terminal domain-containing protein [Bacillales bacterium]